MIFEDINEITIYEVETLKTKFLEELTQKSALTLDMKNIEKIDAVGLQLLLSLVQSAKEMHKTVKFENINEAILKDIDLLHCTTALGITHG